MSRDNFMGQNKDFILNLSNNSMSVELNELLNDMCLFGLVEIQTRRRVLDQSWVILTGKLPFSCFMRPSTGFQTMFASKTKRAHTFGHLV